MFQENLRKALDKNNKGTGLYAKPHGNNFHRKATLTAICILTIIILGATIANFGSTITVVRAGSVESLGAGIYWDQTCTNRTFSLNWGPIEAGSNNTLTVYVKNERNSAVSLWLGTSNWNPSASAGYMSLNWNYSGQLLSEDQVIALELTLTVSPTISGITVFSFDTIITTISVR